MSERPPSPVTPGRHRFLGYQWGRRVLLYKTVWEGSGRAPRPTPADGR